MRRRLLLLAVATNLGIAACVFGPTVESVRPAYSPEGEVVRVTLQQGGGTGFVAQLISVDSAGLTVLADSLAEHRWHTVTSLQLNTYRRTFYFGGRTPAPAELRLLRALSRHPEGLDSLRRAAIREARRP